MNATSIVAAAVRARDLIACEATEGRLYSVVSVSTMGGLISLGLGRVDAGVVDERYIVLNAAEPVLAAA